MFSPIGSVHVLSLLPSSAPAAGSCYVCFDFQVIARRANVCKQLHMPAQSGSSSLLERMRRGYTRQAYDDLVDHVRELVPGVSLSTDIISGVHAAKLSANAP